MKCRTPILKYADTLLKAIASLLSVCRVVIVGKLATAVNISVFSSKYQQETSWNIWIKPCDSTSQLQCDIQGFFFFLPKRRNKLKTQVRYSLVAFFGCFFFFFGSFLWIRSGESCNYCRCCWQWQRRDGCWEHAEIDFSVDIPAPVNTADVHRRAHLRILNTARLSLKAADSFVFTAVWERLWIGFTLTLVCGLIHAGMLGERLAKADEQNIVVFPSFQKHAMFAHFCNR